MVILHFKLNKTVLFRAFVAIIILVALAVLALSIFKLIQNTYFASEHCLANASVLEIPGQQYTNVLKEVYENTNSYLGQTIQLTGYIYQQKEFEDSQFVLARDMLINSDSQAVVVGFLCSYKDAIPFPEGTWVQVTGTIIQGYFHNEIPVIDILTIEETTKPEEPFVYPPDPSYIPTAYLF